MSSSTGFPRATAAFSTVPLCSKVLPAAQLVEDRLPFHPRSRALPRGCDGSNDACIATSCDVNNWEAEKDQAFDEAVQEVETMLEAFGMESKTAVIADEYDMNFTKYYLYYSSQEAKAKWDPI